MQSKIPQDILREAKRKSIPLLLAGLLLLATPAALKLYDTYKAATLATLTFTLIARAQARQAQKSGKTVELTGNLQKDLQGFVSWANSNTREFKQTFKQALAQTPLPSKLTAAVLYKITDGKKTHAVTLYIIDGEYTTLQLQQPKNPDITVVLTKQAWYTLVKLGHKYIEEPNYTELRKMLLKMILEGQLKTET